MMEKRVIIPREVSFGVFEDFIKTFGKYYQADQKPRDGFDYMVPLDFDSETKLVLATQNMEKMGEMFSPEFRKQESVLIARIPGTPYLLRMSYGFGRGSSGVYIITEEVKNGRTQGVYRIGVDTQQTENGEALRVAWISGFPDRREQIQEIFPQRIGLHPGLALLCVALDLAQQKGFEVLSGIKGDKYEIQAHVLDANPGAIYDRFKLTQGKGNGEYARWRKTGDLLDIWKSETPKVRESWTEGAGKMFAAFKELKEVRIDQLNDFVEREFAEPGSADADAVEKRSEMRENSFKETAASFTEMVEGLKPLPPDVQRSLGLGLYGSKRSLVQKIREKNATATVLELKLANIAYKTEGIATYPDDDFLERPEIVQLLGRIQSAGFEQLLPALAKNFIDHVRFFNLEGRYYDPENEPFVPFTYFDFGKDVYFRTRQITLNGESLNITQALVLSAPGAARRVQAELTEFFLVNGVYVGCGVTRYEGPSRVELQYNIFPQVPDTRFGRGQIAGLSKTIYQMRLETLRQILDDGAIVTVPQHQFSSDKILANNAKTLGFYASLEFTPWDSTVTLPTGNMSENIFRELQPQLSGGLKLVLSGLEVPSRSESRAGEQPVVFPKAADLENFNQVTDYAWEAEDKNTGKKWYLKLDGPLEMDKEVNGYRLAGLVGVNTSPWTQISVEDISMPDSKSAQQWDGQILNLGYDLSSLGSVFAILSRDANDLTLPELADQHTSGIEKILAFLALTGATDFKLEHNVGISTIDGRKYYALFDLTNAAAIQPTGTPFSFDDPLVLDALDEMTPEALTQAVREVSSINPQDLQRVLGGTPEDTLRLLWARQEALGATVRQALSVVKTQNAERLGAENSAQLDMLINALAGPDAQVSRSEIRTAAQIPAALEERIGYLQGIRERIASGSIPEILTFGDKHGKVGDLEAVLVTAQKAKESGKQLHIIGHGDGFDRGDESGRVWEIFKELKLLAKDHPNIKVDLLLGNHDIFIIEAVLKKDPKAFRDWMVNGGETTLLEFGFPREEIGAVTRAVQAYKQAEKSYSLTAEKKFSDEMDTALGVIDGYVAGWLGGDLSSVRPLAHWMVQNLKLFVEDERGFLHVHAGIPITTNERPMVDRAGLEKLGKEWEALQNGMVAEPNFFDQEGNQKRWAGFISSAYDIFWASQKDWLDQLSDETVTDNYLGQLGYAGVIGAHIHLKKLSNVGNRVFVVDVDEGDPGHLIFNNDGTQFQGVDGRIDRVASKEEVLAVMDAEIARLQAKLEKMANAGQVIRELGNAEDLAAAFDTLDAELAKDPKNHREDFKIALAAMLRSGDPKTKETITKKILEGLDRGNHWVAFNQDGSVDDFFALQENRELLKLFFGYRPGVSSKHREQALPMFKRIMDKEERSRSGAPAIPTTRSEMRATELPSNLENTIYYPLLMELLTLGNVSLSTELVLERLETAKQMVSEVRKALGDEQILSIYVGGSFIWRMTGEPSDIDFMVVLKNSKELNIKTALPLPPGFPVSSMDIIIIGDQLLKKEVAVDRIFRSLSDVMASLLFNSMLYVEGEDVHKKGSGIEPPTLDMLSTQVGALRDEAITYLTQIDQTSTLEDYQLSNRRMLSRATQMYLALRQIVAKLKSLGIEINPETEQSMNLDDALNTIYAAYGLSTKKDARLEEQRYVYQKLDRLIREDLWKAYTNVNEGVLLSHRTNIQLAEGKRSEVRTDEQPALSNVASRKVKDGMATFLSARDAHKHALANLMMELSLMNAGLSPWRISGEKLAVLMSPLWAYVTQWVFKGLTTGYMPDLIGGAALSVYSLYLYLIHFSQASGWLGHVFLEKEQPVLETGELSAQRSEMRGDEGKGQLKIILNWNDPRSPLPRLKRWLLLGIPAIAVIIGTLAVYTYFRGLPIPKIFHPSARVVTQVKAPVLTVFDQEALTGNLEVLRMNMEKIQDEKMQRIVRHYLDTIEFLRDSEKTLYPQASDKERAERIQHLAFAAVYLTYLENPTFEPYQKKKGPAAGPFQIEAQTAVDLFREAMNAPEGSPVRQLIEKNWTPGVATFYKALKSTKYNTLKKEEMRTIRESIASDATLQHLLWRLFIYIRMEPSAKEVAGRPGEKDGWPQFHGRYNTPFLADTAKPRNEGEEAELHYGLATRLKATAVKSFMAQLVEKTMSESLSASNRQQTETLFKNLLVDLYQVENINAPLTNALRRIRDAESLADKIDAEMGKPAAERNLAKLQGYRKRITVNLRNLNNIKLKNKYLADARRALEALNQYSPKGYQPGNWESIQKEANDGVLNSAEATERLIVTLNGQARKLDPLLAEASKARKAITTKGRGRSEMRILPKTAVTFLLIGTTVAVTGIVGYFNLLVLGAFFRNGEIPSLLNTEGYLGIGVTLPLTIYFVFLIVHELGHWLTARLLHVPVRLVPSTMGPGAEWSRTEAGPWKSAWIQQGGALGYIVAAILSPVIGLFLQRGNFGQDLLGLNLALTSLISLMGFFANLCLGSTSRDGRPKVLVLRDAILDRINFQSQYQKGGRLFAVRPRDGQRPLDLAGIAQGGQRSEVRTEKTQRKIGEIGEQLKALEAAMKSRSEQKPVLTTDPWGSQKAGEAAQRELLEKNRKVSDLHNVLLYLGDLDKIGATNLLASKSIIGVLGTADSPDLLFQPKSSPYLEFRKMWKEILEKHGATVYRGVGGDEFVIVSGNAFDLDGALREFTQAFRDRYSILRVTRPLAREERPFLIENPYVIAAANYGMATHILVDRKKLNEDGKWNDFTLEVQMRLNLTEGQFFERQFETKGDGSGTKDRGFFSASTGAVSADKVLDYLSDVMKDKGGRSYWTLTDPVEGEVLREDRMELFLLWARRLANDALTVAKNSGRNQAVVIPSLNSKEDRKKYVQKEITAKKIEEEARKLEDEKSRPVEKVSKERDALTGFYTQAGGNRAARSAGKIERILQFLVHDYGLGEGRAFHALQEKIGSYEKSNEVIRSLGQKVRSILGMGPEDSMEAMNEKGTIVFRNPPDTMMAVLTGARKNRGPPLAITTQALDDSATALKETIKENGVETSKVPDVVVLEAEAEKINSLPDIERLHAYFTPPFKISEILVLVDWFFDAMKSVSIEGLQAAVDVELGAHSRILKFNPAKAGRLLSLYWKAQDKAGEEALREIGGRDVSLFREFVSEESVSRSEMREGVLTEVGTKNETYFEPLAGHLQAIMPSARSEMREDADQIANREINDFVKKVVSMGAVQDTNTIDTFIYETLQKVPVSFQRQRHNLRDLREDLSRMAFVIHEIQKPEFKLKVEQFLGLGTDGWAFRVSDADKKTFAVKVDVPRDDIMPADDIEKNHTDTIEITNQNGGFARRFGVWPLTREQTLPDGTKKTETLIMGVNEFVEGENFREISNLLHFSRTDLVKLLNVAKQYVVIHNFWTVRGLSTRIRRI
jgi:hypothetical protein